MAPSNRKWPARLHEDERANASTREAAVIVRDLAEVIGTDRDVEAPTFSSRRMLLAKDGMGFSLHDTILFAGTETKIHYRNHLEAVYCIEGSAEIVELDGDGAVHEIKPGVMYALDGHERHLLRAITDFRALCVFNPPLTGREVHDEDGVYPLMTEDQ